MPTGQRWPASWPCSRRSNTRFEHVVRGKANKFIASTLGVSRRTVEDRRARVMDKLEVDSLVDLIRIAIDAEIIDANVLGTQTLVS